MHHHYGARVPRACGPKLPKTRCLEPMLGNKRSHNSEKPVNQLADKDFTIDDMVHILTSEYDVDESTARTDCQNIADEWHKVGFLEL